MRKRTCHRGLGVLAALTLALGGCSNVGGHREPPPNPNLVPTGYKQTVADFLRTYLNNPTKVKDAFISEPQLKPIAGATRYVSCVRYNARDPGNQYLGTEEKTVIFFAGSVNQFLPVNRELCDGAVYQRFPEAEVLVP